MIEVPRPCCQHAPTLRHVIRTEEELRRILGEPIARVLAKDRKRVDAQCREFIARSPFVLVASTDSMGHMDISPKGDSAGFVRVLDESTLLIPDRVGNRRGDTFRNVLQCPQVGLLFLIPGTGQALRVSGAASVVHDAGPRAQPTQEGDLTQLALLVHAGEVFFHCPKCIARSKLWETACGTVA